MFFKRLEGKEEKMDIPRDQVVVTEGSWHYRLYRYWETHTAGNKKNYKENLCHYMRVVLFWAPLKVFVDIRFYKWIRLWAVLLAALCLVVTLICYQIWPQTTSEFLLVVGIVLLFFLGLAGLMVGMYFSLEYIDNHPRVLHFFQVITRPLGKLFGSVDRRLKWLSHKMSWGCNLALFAGLSFGGIYIGGGITMGWILTTQVFLVIIGFIGGLIGLIWLLVITMLKVEEKFTEYRENPAERTPFWLMLWRFLLAIHHRVCPFIVLPQSVRVQEENPST